MRRHVKKIASTQNPRNARTLFPLMFAAEEKQARLSPSSRSLACFQFVFFSRFSVSRFSHTSSSRNCIFYKTFLILSLLLFDERACCAHGATLELTAVFADRSKKMRECACMEQW